MTREEREKAKTIEKNLKQAFKKLSKDYKWAFKDSFAFKAEADMFFEVMVFYRTEQNKASVRVSFKPLVLDELFWELFNMSENKNEPLSFRSFGAYTINAFTLKDWIIEIDEDDDLLEVCKNIYNDVEPIVKDVLNNVKNINDYIVYVTNQLIIHQINHPNSHFNINLELALAYILLGDYKTAYAMSCERLEMNDRGKFIDMTGDTSKGIYDFIKEYCESRLLNK